jgi:hypothetical protein
VPTILIPNEGINGGHAIERAFTRPVDFGAAFRTSMVEATAAGYPSGDASLSRLKQKSRAEFAQSGDFVGNLHQRPNVWIVVGLFYPPHQRMGDLLS